MILSALKKYFNKRNLLFVGLFICIYFLFADIAAAGPDVPPTNAQATDTNKLITTLHGAMQIVGALLGTVTALVTLLLNPGWYNGEVFNLQKYFKEVWILVSNVVYFIFAFVLIWVAFMNIIGKQGENYEIKKALPKLFIGILMVPFSWFMVQFIVSLSNILMVGILSLPFDTFKDFTEMKNISGTICTSFEIDVGGTPDVNANTQAANPNTPTEWYKCVGERKEISALIQEPESVFNIISIYTYGILRLDQLNTTTLDSIKGVKTLGGLAVKVVFDMVFILVYAILMLAIFLALFMRGVWIWAYMMLSPLFGLMYFFGKSEGSDALKNFSIKEFIKLAMVPVYVGGALSFGILFIFVTSKGFEMGDGKATGGQKLINCDGTPPACTIDVFKFKFKIKGAGAAATGINEASSFTKSALGGIILNLFGIAVLWIAVMAALNSSSITQSIVEPIAGFGKSIGETVMKAPQYMPLLPGPGGGLSASALSKVGGSIKNVPEQIVSGQAKPWEKSINNMFGLERMLSQDYQRISNLVANSTSDSDRTNARSEVLKALQQYSSEDENARKLLAEYAAKLAKDKPTLGLKPDDVKIENLFKDGQITEKGYQILSTDSNATTLRAVDGGYVNFKTALKNKTTSGQAVIGGSAAPEATTSPQATINNNTVTVNNIPGRTDPVQITVNGQTGTADDIAKAIKANDTLRGLQSNILLKVLQDIRVKNSNLGDDASLQKLIDEKIKK